MQLYLDDKGVNVGGKTYISNAGLDANGKKVTNVADGIIGKDSKDAINGGKVVCSRRRREKHHWW